MNCDPIARWYRWLEYLGMGRALEHRRFEFLPLLFESSRCSHGTLLPCSGSDVQTRQQSAVATAAENALLLGDGDGRFLAALLNVNHAIRVDYVDSSAKMLALARKRVSLQKVEDRVRFFRADALQWQPPSGASYNLVTTHFFLDCLDNDELRLLLSRLDPFIAPDAVWIVSEFHQPPRGLPAWRAWLWIGGLYRAFGWLTGLRVRRLPDHRTALMGQGFRLEREVVAEWGLLVSEWWQRQN